MQQQVVHREAIEKKVIEACCFVFRREPESLSMDTRFVEDLNIKSLMAIKLTVLLEDAFDVKLAMARVRRNQTIGDCVDMIVEAVNEKQ
jgi:acyl carrier protein